MAAPPNLAVPKGWKPPPGTQKATTQYQPKQTTRNLVQVPRAPRLFTGVQPPTRSFQEAIQHAHQQAQPTRGERHYEAENQRNVQNKTRAELGRQLLSEGKINPNLFKAEGKPNLAEARPGQAPKPGFLDRILKGVGTGVHGLEQGIAAGEHALNVGPIGGRTHIETPGERQAEQQRSARVLTQIGLAKGLGTAGAAAGAGARALEIGGAAKGLESAAIDRGALGALGGRTAQAPGNLRGLAEATGVGRSTAGSAALRTAGGAAAGYGKLLLAATPAKAAAEGISEKPKKNEPFAEKFWHDAIHTVANLPAAAIEGVTHPVKTAEGIAKLYTHPEQAFKENSFGTLLAFLAPAAGVERGLGGAIRKGSKGKFLSTERPDLQYASGARQAREFQPGLVTQQVQKAPDRIAKAVGRGEQPVTAPLKPGEPTPPRDVMQATKMQERRDILGSRMGGLVRPGQVDLIRGGERLARNLEVMKAHHFLDQHLSHDEIHATALMTLLQGEAKTAKSFWPDVANRVAHLKDEQHGLTGTDLAYNREQVARLVNMEQNREKLSTQDLEHYEKSAGQIAAQQRGDWMRLNEQGIGHPDQLNARNLPALLLHGHLMGRGILQHIAEPGPHPLVPLLKTAKDELRAAQRAAVQTKQRLDVETARVQERRRMAPPGLRRGYKSPAEHWVEAWHEARARQDEAFQHVRDIENKLTAAHHARALKPNGDRFPGVYDQQGKRVTPAETEKFLSEHFGREMGFVTQKQDLARARSQNSYGPRVVYPMRTGGNFMAGAYDNSPAALRNHFDRYAHNIATMGGRRSVAENLVRMGPDGKPMTEANALRAADNLNRTPEGTATKPHLGEYVPYNLGAEKATQLITGHPYTKVLEQHGQVEHKALLEEGDKAATWGILPQQVADRLNKWDRIETKVQDSMLRQLTTPWRQTNLYTSVRWPFGTTQENAIRLAFHQVSPLVVLPFGKHTSLSFGTGSHIVRFLDEKINDPTIPHAQKQAAIFHRSQYGTGSFVGAQLHELEPALHQLSEKPFFNKLAESPINTKAWRPYRQFIGKALNRMETNAKVAAGGKLARDDANFFKRYRKIDSEQAARNYVEKITTDPAESIKAAQNLMEIMGNWNHLTPRTREAQAEIAPFALWWLNSAKFVFKTLPRDHPYATGLLAAMVTATGEANRNLKPYLEGTIPLVLPILGAINLNPVHYSPFDIAGEPLPKAGSMIAPQITEPVFTAKGVDPLTGEKFAGGGKFGEGGEGTSAGRLGMTFLESYVPGLRLASQLAREGGVPTKTSILPWEATRKLGLGKAALKSLSPFMFTYNRGAKAKAGRGTSLREPVLKEPIQKESVQREPVQKETVGR